MGTTTSLSRWIEFLTTKNNYSIQQVVKLIGLENYKLDYIASLDLSYPICDYSELIESTPDCIQVKLNFLGLLGVDGALLSNFKLKLLQNSSNQQALLCFLQCLENYLYQLFFISSSRIDTVKPIYTESIVDIGGNSAFALQQYLLQHYPEFKFTINQQSIWQACVSKNRLATKATARLGDNILIGQRSYGYLGMIAVTVAECCQSNLLRLKHAIARILPDTTPLQLIWTKSPRLYLGESLALPLNSPLTTSVQIVDNCLFQQ